MAHRHDARYKRFFSNPILLRQLLESFVPEDFVHDLDFSTLKRLDKSFVTDEFRERESDLIHQIRYKDSTVYIFLLMEFQSRVDRLMPLRFLRYICEFYESLARNNPGLHGRKLPVVFPLLLYNGTRQWTAPLSMQVLIDDSSRIPARYIPHFEYNLVDENAYPPDTLASIQNTVAALFLAEKTPEDKLSEIDRMLYTLVRDEDHGAARELFLWLRDILGDSRPLEAALPVLATMEEEYTMLEETIRRHDRKLYAQGKNRGKTEGRTEVARRMLERGMTLDVIADITGLPEKELPALARSKPSD